MNNNQFVTRINIPEFFQKIEEQKQAALQTPIYVFGSPSNIERMKEFANGFERIFQNEQLFKYIVPNDVEDTIINSTPRTLVFYFYDSGKQFQETWIQQTLGERLSQIPDADIFSIDVTRQKLIDLDKIKQFSMTRYPTLLVFRLGHLVDKIIPTIEGASIEDQIQQYRNEMKHKYENLPHGNPLETNEDRERIEFEHRLRAKQAAERKKEEDARRKELVEVRKKIAENKAKRSKKPK